MLERHHEVLAPTLPGHAGGPPLARDRSASAMLADAVEASMDAAGLGSPPSPATRSAATSRSQLAARGRARSVVALAPAGGWAGGDARGARDSRSLHHAAATC